MPDYHHPWKFPENKGFPNPAGSPQSPLREWDPVNFAGSSVAHGRIGSVAWAIFEHGTGHVLSIEALNGNRTVIHIDTPSERRGLGELTSSLVNALDLSLEEELR